MFVDRTRKSEVVVAKLAFFQTTLSSDVRRRSLSQSNTADSIKHQQQQLQQHDTLFFTFALQNLLGFELWIHTLQLFFGTDAMPSRFGICYLAK
jgi:hypothetical protein